MDVMLSFLLLFFVVRVLESSFRILSFLCFYNHACFIILGPSELRCLESRTLFNGSPLARILRGLLNMFLFGCAPLLTEELMSYSSKISKNLLTLSFK